MEFQKNLKNSLIRNIESSELLDKPFVHKFVENVFPESFYNELINNIPSTSLAMFLFLIQELLRKVIVQIDMSLIYKTQN